MKNNKKRNDANGLSKGMDQRANPLSAMTSYDGVFKTKNSKEKKIHFSTLFQTQNPMGFFCPTLFVGRKKISNFS